MMNPTLALSINDQCTQSSGSRMAAVSNQFNGEVIRNVPFANGEEIEEHITSSLMMPTIG